MPVKRITPKEASDLLLEGYKYLDVRSIPEYEAGHPGGAYNVPLMHFAPGRGMTPNAEFADVVGKIFPKDEKIVVGCKTGGRSLRAAEMLTGLGYTQLVDMRGGFAGERDMGGALVCAGWEESGLPVEKTTPAGKGYEQLK
jgi:rhodanese-related sulfurtransferase